MNDTMTARSGGKSRRRKRGFAGGKSRKRFAFSQQRRKAAPKTFFQKVAAFFSGLFSGGKKQPDASGQKAAASPAKPSAPPPAPKQKTEPARARAPRPPVSYEVTSPRLYVGNLSYDATESDLFELFNGVGKVQNAEVVSHKNTHRSKGFAFVQMQSIEEAKRAVAELHDKEFMGRKLLVSGARPDGPGQSGQGEN